LKNVTPHADIAEACRESGHISRAPRVSFATSE
jgi:hypothetical protein